MKGAIIGGTGFYETGDHLRSETVTKPYGSVDVSIIHHEIIASPTSTGMVGTIPCLPTALITEQS